jgi:predicted metal-binding membrane protein
MNIAASGNFDRALVAAALLAITATAWGYLLFLAPHASMAAMDHAGMSGLMLAHPWHWGTSEFLVTFLMWAIMMVAMMLPSAAPMTLLFAGFARRNSGPGQARAATAVFIAAYLLVWFGFSAGATSAQWAMQYGEWLTSSLESAARPLGAAILFAAGLYQWGPLKQSCLAACQSPLAFLARGFRPGLAGAFRTGLRHGFYCLGCCWALMALLFVGGIMNLLWIGALSAFVLAEKLIPGIWVARLAGMLLMLWGLYQFAA